MNPSYHEHPGILRGRIVTARDLSIEAGQTISKWQALALGAGGGALVAYDSETTGPPYAISMRDVDTTDGPQYIDYLINCEFNAPKLVFANEVDSWQSVIHAYRVKGIYLMPFEGSAAVEGDSSS